MVFYIWWFVGGASCFASVSTKLFGSLVPYRCYHPRFCHLSTVGKDQTVLFWVVSFEYLGVGLGTTANCFYCTRTNPLYAASQIALLTSLMGLQEVSQMQQLDFSLNILVTKNFLPMHIPAIPGMILLLVVAPFSKLDVEIISNHRIRYIYSLKDFFSLAIFLYCTK